MDLKTPEVAGLDYFCDLLFLCSFNTTPPTKQGPPPSIRCRNFIALAGANVSQGAKLS